MSSLELLKGPIQDIQKKYEILTDISMEYNEKVHGSQSHIMQDNSMSLIVYYEVPAEGQRGTNKTEIQSINFLY